MTDSPHVVLSRWPGTVTAPPGWRILKVGASGPYITDKDIVLEIKFTLQLDDKGHSALDALKREWGVEPYMPHKGPNDE